MSDERNASPYSSSPYERPRSHSAQTQSSEVGFSRAPSISRSQKSTSNTPFIIIAFLALVLGLLGGFLLNNLLGCSEGRLGHVAASLNESQLDRTIVGTYRYDGEVYEITARQALEDNASLASVRNADGTYRAPSADMILAFARNQILDSLVAQQNITLTDQEILDYMFNTFGTTNTSELAAYYGLEEAQARDIVVRSARVGKLRQRVTGASAEPNLPSYPLDDDTEVANYEYADYIKSLLGSHWDFTYDRWADEDNPYFYALADMVFSADSANYEAAQMVYSIAREEYLDQNDSKARLWTDYLNQYLGEASIQIASLGA